jgi:hypothetical protein
MGSYSGLNIDPSGFNTVDDSGSNILANSGGISDQNIQDLGYSPVVPDTSGIDLPGQLVGIPGGGASNGAVYGADPSGINALHLSPSVNPTPTGGYMPALVAVANAAAQGFSTYSKGSPSVAIPAVKRPIVSSGVAGLFTTPTGATNWTVIGLVVVAGVVGMIVLAKYV